MYSNSSVTAWRAWGTPVPQHSLFHCPRQLHACRAQQRAVADSTRASVYLLKTPLEGMEALSLLPDPFHSTAALHVGVVLSTTDGANWVFDFLPQQPTDPAVIVQLLSGGAVPAQARVRSLSALPRRRCEFQGATALPSYDALAVAHQFQQEWGELELQLFKLDCRDHARQLVAVLLGG